MKKKFFRVQVAICYYTQDVICASDVESKDVIVGDDIYDVTTW